MTSPATTHELALLQERLRPFVARRVAPQDVDDVLQDMVLRVQRGMASVREDERFGSWVHQLARNTIADHHRTRARHPTASGAVEEDSMPAPEVEPDAGVERALASFVAAFVARLDSPYREAVTLTELQGLTHAQAAEMVGVSLTAMKSRVARGRAHLRRLLEECCDIELDARGRVVDCVATPAAPKGCC
jgi:RNA polymerase sigma-70 factor (ECF subfamily)